MKRVYTCFCTDVIHEGHRNIIREAGKYGELTIGVLSDAAMIRFNRFPTISFEERMQLVKDIPEVSNVVVQDDVMYDKVIEELRPDYVIHGDNWQEGALKAIRDNVEGLLKTYGGEIIDVPYTYNEEVKRIDTRIKEKMAMPEYRRKRLRQLIEGLFLPGLIIGISLRHRTNMPIIAVTHLDSGLLLNQFKRVNPHCAIKLPFHQPATVLIDLKSIGPL